MAVDRLTGARVIYQVRKNIGQPTESRSTFDDDDILEVINGWLQELPTNVAKALQAYGQPVHIGKRMVFDMWKTEWDSTTVNAEDTLVVTAGSRTVYLPSNFYHYESFWDSDHDREIYVLQNIPGWGAGRQLRRYPKGVPRYIELIGNTSNTYWVREAKLYPDVPSGYEPSITLTGWRLPAELDADTDYLDIDPQLEDLVVVGVTAKLLRKHHPAYSRYQEREQNMLLSLASQAREA